MNVNRNPVRVIRRLRMAISNDMHDSEARVIPGISMIKELTQDKLKKLGESTMAILKPDIQRIADKRFGKLKVGQEQSDLFSSEKFRKWFKSVSRVNEDDQSPALEAMITTLTTHYGDDTLAKMLSSASQSGGNWMSARLQDTLLRKWVSDKKTADDVYKLLKLDTEGQSIFNSPTLKTWMDYVSKLKKDPSDLLWKKLQAQYDDAVLAKVIAQSKSDIHRDVYRKLEKSMEKKWLQQDKSMDDVFKLLKLSEETDNIMKNPVLGTWVYYGKTLKKDPYQFLFLVIGVDEAKLARMISTAKQDRTNSPVWNIWMNYLSYAEDKPYKAVYSTLRARFGDEGLAKALSKSKEVDNTVLKLWKANGKTVDDVFNLLNPRKNVGGFLESAALKTWITYVDEIGSSNDKYPAIAYLEKQYGATDTARMLRLAENNAVCSGLVRYLREAQFKKWLFERKTYGEVMKMLSAEGKINAEVGRDFKHYYFQ
uniref:RxLR effector protein n=1 Tax=Phytophthora infestans TaxID=4787 RepID=Q572K1_PHYIN|nr:hypothetical protein, conserved [Phytophthora infestans]